VTAPVTFLRTLAVAVAVAAVTSALAGCAHLVVLRDPLTAGEHNDLGVAYESGGQTTLAEKEYRKSVRLEAHSVRAWVNLGNTQAATGRWHAAENSYRRALRESPFDPDALNNLAVALLQEGRGPGEARGLAERAVAIGGARDSIYRATLAETKRGGQ
jgi:Flp pilus assembly protein TadD